MMNRKKSQTKIAAIFLWLTLFTFTVTPAALGTGGVDQAFFEQSPEVLIKAALVRNVGSITVKIEAGNYTLFDGAVGLPLVGLSPGDVVTFNKLAGSIQVIVNGEAHPTTYRGPVNLVASDKNSLNLFNLQNIKYRDDLRILNLELLAAVNVLDVEKYLYGVVGPEMGVSAAPMEALKAQAIVSRSYALSLYNPAANWDVGIDNQTQVYGGYTAEVAYGGERAVQAVNETRGVVIYYDYDENKVNKPIQAFFHANAGGYTENSENVWLEPLPYLVATPSPFDDYALSYPHQTEGGWPANTYAWTVTMTREELANRISQWNQGLAMNNNRQNGGEQINIGELQEIVISRNQRLNPGETASSRVTQVDLMGSQGKSSLQWERARTFFGLKSSLYDLSTDSDLAIITAGGAVTKVSGGSKLMGLGSSKHTSLVNGQADKYHVLGANSQTNQIPKVFQKITFQGKGHGHGLGMSQWGAMGMANAGYNYEEIIQHYYNQGNNDGKITIGPYRSY